MNEKFIIDINVAAIKKVPFVVKYLIFSKMVTNNINLDKDYIAYNKELSILKKRGMHIKTLIKAYGTKLFIC